METGSSGCYADESSWLDSPPSVCREASRTLYSTPPGLAGVVLTPHEGHGKVNLRRRLDTMTFRNRLEEREEEAAVLAVLALSDSPRSRDAFESAQRAYMVAGGSSQGVDGTISTETPRLTLVGTYRERATQAEKERLKKIELQKEKEWVHTQRLANRILQIKIIRSRTRLSTIHRMARKKIQWPTLCALQEQIKNYASHSKSKSIDITLFYLATFPVDGATFDFIYDFLRMTKDGNVDFVDTYVELILSPFIKERSFLVDSDGCHHPLPDIINNTPFVSSQVSYFTHDLKEDYSHGSRTRVATCKWIQAETKRLTARE